MADVVRTRSQLQSDFADNTTEAITPQMIRNFLASIPLTNEPANLYTGSQVNGSLIITADQANVAYGFLGLNSAGVAIGEWIPEGDTEANNATKIGGSTLVNKVIVSTDTGRFHVLDTATPGGFTFDPIVRRNYSGTNGGTVQLSTEVAQCVTHYVTDNRTSGTLTINLPVSPSVATSDKYVGQRVKLVINRKISTGTNYLYLYNGPSVESVNSALTHSSLSAGFNIPSYTPSFAIGGPMSVYLEMVYEGYNVSQGSHVWHIVSTSMTSAEISNWSNNGP